MEASGCINKTRYFPLVASATDTDAPVLESSAASDEPVKWPPIDKHNTGHPNGFSICCWINIVSGIPGENIVRWYGSDNVQIMCYTYDNHSVSYTEHLWESQGKQENHKGLP